MDGAYIFGDFFSRNLYLYRPEVEGAESIQVVEDTPLNNVSSFAQDGEGEMYVSDYGGQVYRIRKANPTDTRPAISRARLEVYPNPSSGRVILTPGGIAGPRVAVRLYSADGRLARNWERDVDPVRKIELDCGDLPPGLYTLSVSDGTRVFANRLTLH